MLTKFKNDTKGSIAVALSFALLPLLLAVGISIDYSRLSRENSRIQGYLDSAVLAAAHEDNYAAAELAVQKYLLAHQSPTGDLTVGFSKTNSGNVISAVINTKMKNAFMGLIGISESDVVVSSEAIAPMKLSKVKFRGLSGGGWWDKTVKLMVKQKNSTEYVEMAKITYTSPIYSSGIFTTEPDDWIDLGDYADAYLLYEIDDQSFEFDKWCTEGCPTTLRSDDPNWSHRQFINGTQLSKNVKVDIFTIIPCETSKHAWEDGGGHTPDIEYEIQGKCEAVNPMQIHLTN